MKTKIIITEYSTEIELSPQNDFDKFALQQIATGRISIGCTTKDSMTLYVVETEMDRSL